MRSNEVKDQILKFNFFLNTCIYAVLSQDSNGAIDFGVRCSEPQTNATGIYDVMTLHSAHAMESFSGNK